MTLLDALSHYRQFITYVLAPQADGKLTKRPTNWMTGEVSDAHDPAIWTDYATAFACGDGRVGFVLTEQAGFWCVDIDNCLTPEGWSPLAQEVCAALPGCAVEVSVSGQGLHVWGRGRIPPHSTRAPGLELYSVGRFIALGTQATGDIVEDICTPAIAALVAKYFARNVDKPEPAEWTDGPCSGWAGPVEDKDLLRRMHASRSATAAFSGGTKATAADLWDVNIPVLTAAYPSPTAAYDASAVDAALAQHLAFWTGKDCERMLRLMLQSGLNREKWEREDYLPRTILNACSMQRDICADKPLPTEPTQVDSAAPVDDAIYLTPAAQQTYFDKCVYIADINRIITPGGWMYNKERFDVMYGGRILSMDNENSKTTRSSWEAFTSSNAVKFPKVKTCSFRPSMPPCAVWAEGDTTLVNTYWPVEVRRIKGNARPFLEHLAKLLPDEKDRAIMLGYMAAVVQMKGVKFQWAPLIQGTRGNGKTLLSRCVIAAIGRQHSHSPKANEINEKYNSWMENKIFIAVEDIYVPHEKSEVLELLKPMITLDWQEIRGMGQEKVSRDICCNFMLNSNHRDAIRMTDDNRGIAPFFTAQQRVTDLARDGMDGDYFRRLYNWLDADGYAIVADLLYNHDIPKDLNLRGRAPATTSTADAIRESMGNVEQEIMAAIAEGRVGFKGDWISAHYLDQLLHNCGFAKSISRNRRRQILEDLGYIRHPTLPTGQPNCTVHPDGKRSVLYIRQNSAYRHLPTGAVGKQYSEDQEPSGPAPVLFGLPSETMPT